MLNARTSKVDSLSILSIDTSSVLEIGDSHKIDSIANVIAVQREPAIYYAHEFPFTDYSLFSVPLPEPVPIEPFQAITRQDNGTIQVKCLNISFLSASSVLQVGSNECVMMETRIKNIRHLLREPR